MKGVVIITPSWSSHLFLCCLVTFRAGEHLQPLHSLNAHWHPTTRVSWDHSANKGEERLNDTFIAQSCGVMEADNADGFVIVSVEKVELWQSLYKEA